MLIELQEPFRNKWSKGYLWINNENRRVITLNSESGVTFTMTYARYLMSVKIGQEIPDGFEVDHINNDKTDDRIDNLQILTAEQNRLKQAWWYSAMVVQWTIIPCDHCKELFYITQGEINNRLRKGVQHLFCSRSCSAKFHNTLQQNTSIKALSDEEIYTITQLRASGLSSYKISTETGFARNTVMKYW